MATKKETLGAVLAEALGLDADRVSKLTLTCEVGDVNLVEATYVVADAETGAVATELRRYELRDVT